MDDRHHDYYEIQRIGVTHSLLRGMVTAAEAAALISLLNKAERDGKELDVAMVDIHYLMNEGRWPEDR